MDQESITKGILTGIVDRYIHEIACDPDRSIRKLVDMAERTSEGPTQKICYQMMQQMAADQSSPYYEMIHHLVTHTSPQTIKQFGINLGHNAWTFGSGNLRRIMEQNNLLISWAVLIDRSRKPDRIPFSEIRDLVGKGRRSEVYAWVLRTSGTADEWNEYAGLFREYPDCVFALIADPAALQGEIPEEAAEIPNLMIILNTDEGEWQSCAELLSEKGFLFSVCRKILNAEQAEAVLSGSWLEELTAYHPLIAFTIAEDSLPRETALQVKTYMWNTRLEQVYPVMPADLISDFIIINRLITRRDILYRVETDGSLSSAGELQFSPASLTYRDLF